MELPEYFEIVLNQLGTPMTATKQVGTGEKAGLEQPAWNSLEALV